MAANLVDDLDELRRLLADAKRPRVQSLLSSEISTLEKAHQASIKEQQSKPTPLEKKVALPEVRYTTWSTLSWDQDSEKVKIYISLEGASPDNTVTDFQSGSFDLKIHDVGGKNYRCGVPRLNKSIVPEQSRVVVKPKRIMVLLKKADRGHWMDLHHKEEKFKPSADKDKDPMAGIMDLMKNMYEEGDDEMKKTIAKAWTDARSGKNPTNPMLGDKF